MKDLINLFMSAILAGICISIGCIVNLKIGGVVGAVLFSFGLLAVVHYGYSLYTGTAGFITSFKDLLKLFFFTLTGNLVGCFLVALSVGLMMPEVRDFTIPIVEQRLSQEWYSSLLRAVFCGFLMTTAVKFGRGQLFLPLLFAVPVFILSGFYHSIADFCYLSINQLEINWVNYQGWVYSVLGNFIGCNLYRIRFINP